MPIRSSIVVVAMSALLVGCGSRPTHTAEFWLWPGEAMRITPVPLEDGPAVVRLGNAGPGPLSAVEWVRADGSTLFNGVPPGDRMELTMSPGDQLVVMDGGGSQLSLRAFHTSRLEISNAAPVGTLRGLTVEQLKERLAQGESGQGNGG